MRTWWASRSAAIGDWLWWQSASLLVVLYVVGKAAERLLLGRRWHSFGRLDMAELIVLAVAVGTATWYVRRRAQRRLAALERERQQMAILVAENAAVIRAVGAAVREVAQPLSGVLSYSELLLLSSEHGDPAPRCEVEGLREGALHLERLLHALRQTIDSAAACDAAQRLHLAEAVERSVAAPRPRPAVRYTPGPAGPA